MPRTTGAAVRKSPAGAGAPVKRCGTPSARAAPAGTTRSQCPRSCRATTADMEELQISMRIVEQRFFSELRTKIRKRLTNFCEYFGLGAVRRYVNLVDLEKCYKMSIWLQKSASIQKRTSPLKFDHSRFKMPDFIASSLSTKVGAARSPARRCRRRGSSTPRSGPARARGTAATPTAATAAPLAPRRLSARPRFLLRYHE